MKCFFFSNVLSKPKQAELKRKTNFALDFLSSLCAIELNNAYLAAIEFQKFEFKQVCASVCSQQARKESKINTTITIKKKKPKWG